MPADDNKKPERNVTDGALALRAYLESKDISITVFCQSNGLDRVQVQRVLNGERGKRITVAFADAIARATDGAVPISAWTPKHPESSRDLSADATGPRQAQPQAVNDAPDTELSFPPAGNSTHDASR